MCVYITNLKIFLDTDSMYEFIIDHVPTLCKINYIKKSIIKQLEIKPLVYFAKL